MNKNFIIHAVVGKKLDDAFNNIEFCHHIFNDKSPENISILEALDKAEDAIRTAKDKISGLSNTNSVKQEIEKELEKRMVEKPNITKGPRPR